MAPLAFSEKNLLDTTITASIQQWICWKYQHIVIFLDEGAHLPARGDVMGMLYHTSPAYGQDCYRLLHHLWQEECKARCIDSGSALESPSYLPGQLRRGSQHKTKRQMSCNIPSSFLTAGNLDVLRVDRKGKHREQIWPCRQLRLQTSRSGSRGLQSCSRRRFPL